MYIDTHCHLYHEYYEDIDKLIKECINNNCNILITNGCDLKTSIESLELANKYNEVYASIGFHPTELKDYDDNWLSWLEKHINDKKVVAIGEIGLDYHYEDTNKEKEISVFKKQLDLAQRYHMPIIVHSRDATEDTLNTLKDYKLKGIIHGFSGSVETAKEYIKLGFKLGVNGVVTFKNAHLKETIKEIGIENIVIETDSPYLTPVPYRGQKNYPYNVKIVVDFLADYLSVSKDEILQITANNVKSIFSIIQEDHIL